MRSLSLKIFLWFWLAVLVGSLAFVIVAICLPSQTIVGRAAKYFSFNLASTGRLSIDLYETKGPQAMETFLGQIETLSAFKLHIITQNGRSLRENPLPEGALALAARAAADGVAKAQDWTSHPLIAQPVTSVQGEPYTIFLELPSGLVQLFFEMSQSLALRFTAALLASGLVWFVMVRYLTSPIRKLQTAVRKFAKGDLSVRIGPKMGSRKDEIAELGEDFDIMAARIESLMHAHEYLLRDVAHELRSPLTRLNVALEIARKQGDETMAGNLDRIFMESQKLSYLITQVLALSRMENSDVDLQLEPVCLEKLIDRIVRDANFEGQGKHFDVHFAFENSITLSVDDRLIHSAIENVVRNALRFTALGSQVEITQSIRNKNGASMAVVSIADQGPGVPPESLKDLFNPFFRVPGSQGRTSGGAGIGLAIASHAVHLHHGTIQAVNRANGGLRVEIRLPMDTPQHH